MKKIHKILRLGLIGAGLVGTAQEAGAQMLAALPGPAMAARIVGEARPIVGWMRFCERMPAECDVDLAEPATLQLTAKTWQTVVSVNRRVNTTLKPMTDQEHWGVPDSWDIPTDGAGDCEDYQLLKRKLLVEAGVPRRALRITVVIDEKREGHAVLMVRTDRGDFILDNKTNSVLPWHETGYVYVKREGQDGTGWVSLGHATAPLGTANQ